MKKLLEKFSGESGGLKTNSDHDRVMIDRGDGKQDVKHNFKE